MRGIGSKFSFFIKSFMYFFHQANERIIQEFEISGGCFYG